MGKSFLIAVLIHLTVFIVFGIWITTNPLTSTAQPMSVEFQSDTVSLSAGVGDQLYTPVKKMSPHMTSRVTAAIEKNAVPEKINPQKNTVNNLTHLKETLKQDFNEKNQKSELAKDLIKQPVIREDKILTPDHSLVKSIIEEGVTAPAQEEKPSPENSKINKELSAISGNIDKVLEENTVQSDQQAGYTAGSGTGQGGFGTGYGSNPYGSNDPLGGAKWSLKPRKTVFFPDIQSKIPDEYKKKGMSYSITARMVFDNNGLAIRVDIIRSSGDPDIDRIFFSELKKIRVEPVNDYKTDEITKTFSINLK